jgi:RHS repeat-associated protein
MYDEKGERTWEMELDIYGKVHTFAGRSLSDCPFRWQGQYEDAETGLYYNRFRYYSPDEGMYLSQDPIGLKGGVSLYSYVHDTNVWIDMFGLSRLPQSDGSWSGEKGNSVWTSTNPKVNGVTGGEGISFKDGYADFSKWSQGNFDFDNLTGTNKDFDLVHERIKNDLNLRSKAEAKRFLKENGLTAHHHQNMRTIQLIPTDLHANVPHEGGASKLRKASCH